MNEIVVAMSYVLAAFVGLGLGFVLAAMLLYRDRVKPDTEEEITGDGSLLGRDVS